MDEKPRKRAPRSDIGKKRSPVSKDWRGSIYLSRTRYPGKAIVQKLEDHFKEYPGDNLSKLFEREMAGILSLPFTEEMTIANLIDRMTILVEEQEVKLEAMDKRIERLDRLISRIESGGISLSASQSAAPMTDHQSTQRSDEGASYLGNMFGGMKSRQQRAKEND
jgi:hypothetical protein